MRTIEELYRDIEGSEKQRDHYIALKNKPNHWTYNARLNKDGTTLTHEEVMIEYWEEHIHKLNNELAELLLTNSTDTKY